MTSFPLSSVWRKSKMNDFHCPYNLPIGCCRCCEDIVSDLCRFGKDPDVFAMRLIDKMRKARGVRNGK
jgi:hypothetical protein